MSRPVEAALAGFFDAAEGDFAAAADEHGQVVHHLSICGVRVALTFAGSALADALLPALASRLVQVSGTADVAIDLWEEGPGALPIPWRDGHLAAGGLLRGERDGSALVVHEFASRAVTAWHPERRRILHRVPSAAGVPWWERAAPLRPAFFWALGGPGRQLVHAGAVGDDRGGVLLAGRGGSGKTSTALAALAAGLRYVSDDYVLLDAGGPRAWNVFGTAKIDEGHESRWPGLGRRARRSPDPEPGEKAVLDVARELPGALVDQLPVRAVIVPQIRGGTSALRPLPSARALLALAPSTIFQMPFDDAGIFPALAGLVRGVPCYALDVGDRPEELAPLVASVLEAS